MINKGLDKQKSTIISDSAVLSYGAGNGNRTHLPSLGSRRPDFRG